jgi:hypothetical protein
LYAASVRLATAAVKIYKIYSPGKLSAIISMQ